MPKKEEVLIIGFALALGLFLGYLVFSYLPFEKSADAEQLGIEMGQDNDGWAFFNKGELDSAREEFEKYIANNQRNAYAHFGLGLLHQQKKDYKRSLEELFSAQTLNPDIPHLAKNLGITLYFLQNYEGSVQNLEKAVADNPRDEESALLLGRAYLKKERFEEAERMFLKQNNISVSYALSRVDLFLSAYGEGNEDIAKMRLTEMWPSIWTMKSKPDERFMAFVECALPQQKDAKHVFECGDLL